MWMIIHDGLMHGTFETSDEARAFLVHLLDTTGKQGRLFELTEHEIEYRCEYKVHFVSEPPCPEPAPPVITVPLEQEVVPPVPAPPVAPPFPTVTEPPVAPAPFEAYEENPPVAPNPMFGTDSLREYPPPPPPPIRRKGLFQK